MSQLESLSCTQRQIFVREDGSKVNFFLHPRLQVPELINLRNRIRVFIRCTISLLPFLLINSSVNWQEYGGEVCSSETEAQTIIVPLYTDTYKELQERWALTQTWVEGPGFIDQCIEQGSYAHLPVQAKRLAGRVPGGRYVDVIGQNTGSLCPMNCGQTRTILPSR